MMKNARIAGLFSALLFGAALLCFAPEARAQAQCPAGQADLSKAVAVINYALPLQYGYFGLCPNGLCSQGYDCSGLSSNVASQIAGYSGGLMNTLAMWNALKTKPTYKASDVINNPTTAPPVVWCLQEWNESPYPGHVLVSVCGHIGNASGWVGTIHGQDGKDYPFPQGIGAYPANSAWHDHAGAPNPGSDSDPGGLICYVPPGLESLTWDSCTAACTAEGAPPPAGGGASADPPEHGDPAANYGATTITANGTSCESTGDAKAGLESKQQDIQDMFDKFVKQEVDPAVGTDAGGYASNLMNVAFKNLGKYYLDFAKKMADSLNAWAATGWVQDFKGVTGQLSLATTVQAYAEGPLGLMQLGQQAKSLMESQEVRDQLSYQPILSACVVDASGNNSSRVLGVSRALNSGLTKDALARTGLREGWTTSASIGASHDLNWQEYVTYFCDPRTGDEGCRKSFWTQEAQPAYFAGENRDLGAVLWQNPQTIDLTRFGSGNNSFYATTDEAGNLISNDLFVAKKALQTLIDPKPPQPVPPASVTTPYGQITLLARRARLATLGTIYNTMGAMLSERMAATNKQDPASPQNPQKDIVPDTSYREIQETLIRDHYSKPTDLLNLISNPAQVTREQGVTGALRLQTMNDIYRRMEEMLFMESASYSSDLNKEMPKPKTESRPINTR